MQRRGSFCVSGIRGLGGNVKFEGLTGEKPGLRDLGLRDLGTKGLRDLGTEGLRDLGLGKANSRISETRCWAPGRLGKSVQSQVLGRDLGRLAGYRPGAASKLLFRGLFPSIHGLRTQVYPRCRSVLPAVAAPSGSNVAMSPESRASVKCEGLACGVPKTLFTTKPSPQSP